MDKHSLFLVLSLSLTLASAQYPNSKDCASDVSIVSWVSVMEHPPTTVSFDAKSWCSEWFRPYPYTVYRTTPPGPPTQTLTKVYETEATFFSTTTIQSTATTTALCPTPSSSMTCKFSSSRNVDPKYLIASYNNRELDGITREECHQACLQNPECKAFGLTQWRSFSLDSDPRTGCSLYRVSVSQDLYVQPERRDYLYDRGCPDYLPPGCSSPNPPQITNAPVAAEKRDELSISQPDWFYDYDYWGGYYIVNQACSCLITTRPPPITTITYTLTENIVHLTSTKTFSAFIPFTVRPNFSTVYTSVKK
ncbi:hypothetical protein GLAREA_03476 [Glarea lozoyensis ATCC 20868]|uniref:Apple domain-containing protein n=1 Tax=Glarea lozoyensis (strain ATCC 20868 / MF5171) TaxID=1116229 RepID=S3D022_GLAL2|nr:uncharacterized protein GLAREA_03476 [Glarea lozoyensis ATCC 20868]EPE30509.1 hypothetical protein GLAREA_03476 [Glarea lozoyensis ATCC 20868]